MKKLSILVILSIISVLGYSQAKKSVSEKVIDSVNSALLPQRIQGYISISNGPSVTHPRYVAGLSGGIIWKSFEWSVTGNYTVHKDNLTLLSTNFGYRFPINEVVSVTPGIGLWTIWTEGEPIKWTGGNRFSFYLTARHRVNDRINVIVTGTDYRSLDAVGKRTGTDRDKYNAMKNILIGAEYTF